MYFYSYWLNLINNILIIYILMSHLVTIYILSMIKLNRCFL